MTKSTAAAKSATTATTAAPSRTCACTCGAPIGRKSTFAMGHDARFVSLAAADLARGSLAYTNQVLGLSIDDGNDIQDNLDEVAAAIAAKFSERLAAKYDGAAHNAWARAVSNASKAEAKVGRDAEKANKAAATAATPAPVVPVEGFVKVGRWQYPANQVGTQVTRNTKRDGTGDQVVVADGKVAATFIPRSA